MRARFSWLMSVVLATFVLAGSLTAQINTCNARGVVSDQNQNPVVNNSGNLNEQGVFIAVLP